MTESWKVGFMIVVIFFILENGLIFYLYKQGEIEEEKIKICHYDVCSEYEDASYYEDVCECYDYDMIGNSIIAHQEYMP